MAGNVRIVNRHDGSRFRKKGESHTAAKRRLPPVGITTRREQKRRKFSQTPGTSKVESCQATPFDKIHAARTGSWKWPTYSAWCDRMDRKAAGTVGR